MYVAFSTVEKKKDAEKIAKYLVDKRIVACVNVIKIENSFYRWKGKTEISGEYLLVMKLSKKNFDRLEREIRHIHPYEVPELVAMKVEKSANKYSNWVKRCCL
jgi:periplasmic divalent cation tolerance protein